MPFPDPVNDLAGVLGIEHLKAFHVPFSSRIDVMEQDAKHPISRHTQTGRHRRAFANRDYDEVRPIVYALGVSQR